MAYTNIQFIGYVLDTAPQVNPDGSKTYLGLNDPKLDIEARCEADGPGCTAADVPAGARGGNPEGLPGSRVLFPGCFGRLPDG